MGLSATVVCDTIPTGALTSFQLRPDALGLSQMKRGVGGEGERTLGSEMGSDWFEP